MKLFHLFLSGVFIFAQTEVFAQKPLGDQADVEVLGKITEWKKGMPKNPFESKLYFQVNYKKDYAYPLVFKNSKLEVKAKSLQGKPVRLHARAHRQVVSIAERQVEAVVLVVEKVEVLDLHKIPDQPLLMAKKVDPHKPSQDGGKYQLDDKVANSLIFVGGAALLGAYFLEPR